MQDKLKNLAWIIFGGYAIGILIHRGWDSVRGIPNLVDVSLVDLDSILYGGSFIALWIWLLLAVLAIVEHRPWAEAREHWDRCYPGKQKSLCKIPWLLFRWQNTILTYLFIYYFVAFIFCVALTGPSWDGVKIFLGWCFLVFSNWFAFIGTSKKWFGNEPDTLERNAVKILNLPTENGKFVVISVVTSLLFGIWLYPKISQSFGGGKPDKAIVFLTQGHSTKLSSSNEIEGKLVDIVFRKGTKIGFKDANSPDDCILVIDQDRIDRIYVGNNINKLDINKLK